MRRAIVATAVMAAAGILVSACGEETPRDLATYCEEYRNLSDNNPFVALEVASPGEMRTALGDIVGAATRMAAVAPGSLERLATDYREAVEEVESLLDAAHFDPRNLDTPRYRRATISYDEAAAALSKETRALCEEIGRP